MLTFEVMGFRGAYHAILGRPCYAKFMAVPNYTYLKMKMPGPNGIITVGSSIEHAFDCDVECVEHVEALALDEALVTTLEKMVNEDLDSTTKHAGNFEAAEQTKEVPLDPAAPEGKALRVSSAVDFLRANADIFAWSPSDMPGIPGRSPSTPLTSCLIPVPCSNGSAASTRSGGGRSERSYGSFSRPGSSRKCSTLRG
jgi:hypothetical protein